MTYHAGLWHYQGRQYASLHAALSAAWSNRNREERRA